jgi:hypothetical protein
MVAMTVAALCLIGLLVGPIAIVLIGLPLRHRGRRLICAVRGHAPRMVEFDDGTGHREWCPRCQRHWAVERGVDVQQWMPMS